VQANIAFYKKFEIIVDFEKFAYSNIAGQIYYLKGDRRKAYEGYIYSFFKHIDYDIKT